MRKSPSLILVQAAWANHYTVQRPGLADLFFDSASEERDHAFKLLSYLRMRGHNELDVLPSALVQSSLHILILQIFILLYFV